MEDTGANELGGLEADFNSPSIREAGDDIINYNNPDIMAGNYEQVG